MMTKDRKLALMRSAKTNAENRTGMGGREKNPRRKPKPVSLAPVIIPPDDEAELSSGDCGND
jgi:hypothetical protein